MWVGLVNTSFYVRFHWRLRLEFKRKMVIETMGFHRFWFNVRLQLHFRHNNEQQQHQQRLQPPPFPIFRSIIDRTESRNCAEN